MRIVHVEDFFHPDAGYQVNLLSKIQVDQGHEVVVVTSEFEKLPEYLTVFFGRDRLEEKDKIFEEKTGVKIMRIPLIAYVSGRSIYDHKIFKIIDNLKPSVLFVHGEDTMIGIQYIIRSLWQKYPMILDCHMLEMASENRFKGLFRFFLKRFITPIIIKKKIPLVRVVDSDYVEKCLGLPLSKTILLSFGTDVSWYSPNAIAKKQFREEHGIDENDYVVLYAGKIDEYKGGKFLADSIHEKFESIKGRNMTFVIIGSGVGEYGANVDAKLKESENRILRFPTQAYLDLAIFYQAADVAIFAKQCSLSFFDVQSCGLPVIFEENEINNQRIVGKNAITFEPGNLVDFRRKIVQFGQQSKKEFEVSKKDSRDFVLKEYNYLPIAHQFTDVLREAVDNFRQ